MEGIVALVTDIAMEVTHTGTLNTSTTIILSTKIMATQNINMKRGINVITIMDTKSMNTNLINSRFKVNQQFLL